MKKPVVLITFFCIIFFIFLVFYLKPHSYKLDYKIKDINVTEIYHKEEAYYTFNLNYDNIDYEVISFDKYINKRKLIEDINITKENDVVCLDFTNSLVSIYPICFDKEKYFSPYMDKSTFNLEGRYENIEISDLNNMTYLLWNYHEFIYLNSEKNSKISLFSKDIYNMHLIYQLDKFLIIPDYSQDYKFNKLYVINKDNGKTSSIKLRYEVYFDSYFLGNDKKKVYLYDLKNEQEYYIDLKKEEIYKTSNKVLIDNNWKKVSNQKLKNDKPKFSEKEVFNYFLKDNILFATYSKSSIEFQVSSRSVSQIIKTDGLDIYYLSEDTLYYFNPTIGEKALLKYSEWKFNNQNMIFVF